eukprot:gene22591-biopygen22921
MTRSLTGSRSLPATNRRNARLSAAVISSRTCQRKSTLRSVLVRPSSVVQSESSRTVKSAFPQTFASSSPPVIRWKTNSGIVLHNPFRIASICSDDSFSRAVETREAYSVSLSYVTFTFDPSWIRSSTAPSESCVENVSVVNVRLYMSSVTPVALRDARFSTHW